MTYEQVKRLVNAYQKCNEVDSSIGFALDNLGVKNGYSSLIDPMYSIAIANLVLVLCKNCADTLFRKMLKESCAYDAKVKRPEDMKRIERARLRRENNENCNK